MAYLGIRGNFGLCHMRLGVLLVLNKVLTSLMLPQCSPNVLCLNIWCSCSHVVLGDLRWLLWQFSGGICSGATLLHQIGILNLQRNLVLVHQIPPGSQPVLVVGLSSFALAYLLSHVYRLILYRYFSPPPQTGVTEELWLSFWNGPFSIPNERISVGNLYYHYPQLLKV